VLLIAGVLAAGIDALKMCLLAESRCLPRARDLGNAAAVGIITKGILKRLRMPIPVCVRGDGLLVTLRLLLFSFQSFFFLLFFLRR
jgi:hypothetical protein